MQKIETPASFSFKKKTSRQILKMMKTVILFLWMGLTGVYGSYAQTKLSIHLENETLEQLIEDIQEQSEFIFFYKDGQVDLQQKISITLKNASIEEILEQAFRNTELDYAILGRQIAIVSGESVSDSIDIKISGKVTDEDALPLPGATVLIKGTYKGITTDKEGNYAIKVPGPETILVFSFVGFKSQEITVGVQTTINVTLEQAATELEEVTINAGYYTVKEREKTGNISRIDAKAIEKQPVNNPLAALQGRMTGVSIEQNSGVPGDNFTIRIRGKNSIRNDGNEPLYIVNGVPYPGTPITSRAIAGILPRSISPFSSINPSDIESIEILKDADATAIYGSRGANGVVLITTKKGKPGKLKVNVNASQGIGVVANKMDLLNTQQHLEIRKEALKNSGFWPLPEQFHRFFPDLFIWDTTRYTDWQEVFWGGTANTTNLQTSVTGGSENTRFLLSGAYYRETTVFPSDRATKRGSVNFNFIHSSTDQRFRIELTTSFVSNLINLPPVDYTREALNRLPNAPPIFDDNGELNWEWGNPLASVEADYNATTDNFISNLLLSYQLFQGFKIKTSLGYTNIRTEQFTSSPLRAIDPAIRHQRTASSFFSNGSVKTWIIEPQLEYQKKIAQGRLTVMVGGTFQEDIAEDEYIQARGYTSDALLRNIQAAPDVSIGTTNFSEYRYNAIFGRINYQWKDKYIVNLTGRRDGSSKFGPGKQFANFGAVGAAWIFSNEDFIRNNLSFISFGKLRFSYGSTGNDQIGHYQYLDSYEPTKYPYQDRNGLIPTRIANPDFSWETNRKLEAGLELGLIRDWIFFSASWYRNRSSDQLVGFPLPNITGRSTIQFNLPATVENTGWEFELNTTNISTGDFQWTTTFNLTIPKNKLVEYPNLEGSPYAHRYRVGKSLFIVRGLHYLGVDPETGSYTFEDVNGNRVGTDFPEDVQYQKEIARQYFGGLQNTFRYRGLELDIFFQFVKQTGQNHLSAFQAPGGFSNQPIHVLDRWQQPGDITDVGQIKFGGLDYFYLGNNSDARISDASFIRLKNVSLSYQLPQTWLHKTTFQDARVFIQGQNLLTFTDYLGLDPESQSTRSIPPLRVIIVGVQLTF